MNQSIPKLKPRTKAFVDKVIEDPTNQTQAYLDTHKTTNRNTAKVQASKTLTKPNVMIYMQEHINMASRTIVDLSQNAEKEETKLKASQDILDRTQGKATIKQISETTNLNINVEADKELSKNFMDFMKSQTTQN